MNKRRLKALIRVLEKVPTKKFDMGVWGYKAECGTVACAAGHFAMSRCGKDAGVKYTPDAANPKYFDVIYKGHVGCWAMSNVLDICMGDSENIFDPACYNSPTRKVTAKKVISRIKTLLKKGSLP